MTEFEFAQLAIQGTGVIAVVLTLYVYYRQMRTMDAQRQASEREMALRMRPWVGLFGLEHRTVPTPGQPSDVVILTLRNFGTLPAQRARLDLEFVPIGDSRSEPSDAIRREETGVKALVPGEEGNYTVDCSDYPQFARWRASRTDIRILGTMHYALDTTSFRSHFEGKLRFSELPIDGKVAIGWRNSEIL